jgi:hypothetical protein
MNPSEEPAPGALTSASAGALLDDETKRRAHALARQEHGRRATAVGVVTGVGGLAGVVALDIAMANGGVPAGFIVLATLFGLAGAMVLALASGALVSAFGELWLSLRHPSSAGDAGIDAPS